MFDPGVVWLPVLVGAAVLLDVYCGDPALLPHPVRILGNLAKGVEPLLRDVAKQGAPGKDKDGKAKRLRVAGLFGVLLTAMLGGAGAWALASIPTFGPLLALYLAYAGLALGSLLKEGRKVHYQLWERRDLIAARPALAMLVSRETKDLDKQSLCRGLAETISENANDAFMAPCFFLVLGCVVGGVLDGAGIPVGMGADKPFGGAWDTGGSGPAMGVGFLWAYKAVSTLDSMWGYKTKKWRYFGWAAAKTDDILAWLPARLTALSMLLTTIIEHRASLRDAPTLWRSISKDAALTSSPNAGWPMSAAAWLACAWVGGPAVYFGKRVEKPVLGPEQNEWTEQRMLTLYRLVRSSCVLGAVLLVILGTVLLLLLG